MTALSVKETKESGGECGHDNCPARTSASPSNDNNNKVFPDPNFPQTSVNSPWGKFKVRSVRTNFCFGVGAMEGAVLVIDRSWGQVSVQDWSAILFSWRSREGIALTSPPSRYFSIRRRETKLCSMFMNVSGRALSAYFISLKTKLRPVSQFWVCI